MTQPPSHAHAAIVSIGDELVLGQKLDTNSRWLSDQIVARGIVVREHVTLADDLEQIASALARLASVYPLIIITGGLGPTADDLTRQALARIMGEELVEDAAALDRLRAIMSRRGRDLAENQRIQACRPVSATMIENPTGTAPGIRASIMAGACDVFCLPGPPRELMPMFENAVAPALRPPSGRAVITSVLHCLGIGEGDLAKRLGPLMDRRRNPLVGTTASGGVVSIRIRYEGDTALGQAAIAATERECRDAAGHFIYGSEDQTIESAVIDLLRSRPGGAERLVVVESCTGGLLGSQITSVPGSSDVFLGGWITYANEMKSAEVNAPAELIERHGAVSEPVAIAMARGALRHAGPAHHALAITGIAGPGGGTDAKPVGTVFIARASRAMSQPAMTESPQSPLITSEARRFLITGDRADIRERAAKLALMMLRFHLLGMNVPRTLWQVDILGGPLSSD